MLPSPEEIAALPPDGGPQYNRLIFETSPYLLQHARRPIDWYPWGPEAFDKAAKQDKPIFLSLGYATCHWCHVMEHESFTDHEVADALNAGFVAIKVDREERPDVDHLYMTATQALTGSGGWPNTLFLTPDRKPFFAATYIPKAPLLDLLEQVRRLWQTDRDSLNSNAEKIAQGLSEHLSRSASGSIPPSTLKNAADTLTASFDRQWGGFGQAPKFPTPQRLVFLLRAWHRFGVESYPAAALETLRKMRLGGIFDQVGFGFHRYSTDRTWTVPHFEKMLYDQALAVLASLEAYAATADPFFHTMAKETLAYVEQELSDPSGGFHSAQDADSEGIEGKVYVWEESELLGILGSTLGNLALSLFETTAAGNYHELPGANVLRLKPNTSLDSPELAEVRQRLLAVRSKRIPPLKDDKILCDWNGLMIAAFAKAGAVLDDASLTHRAAKAADFILETFKQTNGALQHSHRLGKTQGESGAQDYAFVLWGLVELFLSGGEPKYLAEAKQLADVMIDRFWDEAGGGFYMSDPGQSDLFSAMKEVEEGAIPSGNGVAALALHTLAQILADPRLGDYADKTLEAFGADIAKHPQAFTTSLLALDLRGGSTVILVGEPGEEFEQALKQLRSVYAPRTLILPLRSDRLAALQGVSDFLAGLKTIDAKPTAYICREFTCSLPTTDIPNLSAIHNL